MPCRHELCMPCFKQNVQEASLTCPMCRTRISIWARKAGRNNKLVNESRWREIQEAFPQKVKNRLDGVDDDYSSDEESVPVTLQLAQPGEIRQEYEEQIKKLRAERHAKEREEAAATARLIQKLQEEEEMQRLEMEQLALQDEALAKQLAEQLNELDATKSPSSLKSECSTPKKQKPLPRTLLEKFVKRGTRNTSNSNSPKGHGENEKRERRMTEDKYPYTCISPWQKDYTDSGNKTNSRPSSQKSNSTEDYVYIDSGTTTPNVTDSSTSKSASDIPVIGLTEDIHIEGSPVDIEELDEVAILDPEPASLVNFPQGMFEKEGSNQSSPAPSGSNRSESGGSMDSITQELVYFKPIQASPKTPPKRLPGGKVVAPPLIRSTPTNLPRNSLASPGSSSQCFSPGNPAGSPIIQKRILELAAERQEQVRILSKGTSTDTEEDSVAMDHCYSSPTKRPSFEGSSHRSTLPDLPELPSTMKPKSKHKEPEKLARCKKVTIQDLLQRKKNVPAAATSLSATTRKLTFDPVEIPTFEPEQEDTSEMIQLLPLESNLDEDHIHIVPDTLKRFAQSPPKLTISPALKPMPLGTPEEEVDVISEPPTLFPEFPFSYSPVSHSVQKQNGVIGGMKDLVIEGPASSNASSELGISNQNMTEKPTSAARVATNKEMKSGTSVPDFVKNKRTECDLPLLPSLDPVVITTALTPETIAERKNKVLLKEYVEETPQLVQKMNDVKKLLDAEPCTVSPIVDVETNEESETSPRSDTEQSVKTSNHESLLDNLDISKIIGYSSDCSSLSESGQKLVAVTNGKPQSCQTTLGTSPKNAEECGSNEEQTKNKTCDEKEVSSTPGPIENEQPSPSKPEEIIELSTVKSRKNKLRRPPMKRNKIILVTDSKTEEKVPESPLKRKGRKRKGENQSDTALSDECISPCKRNKFNKKSSSVKNKKVVNNSSEEKEATVSEQDESPVKPAMAGRKIKSPRKTSKKKQNFEEKTKENVQEEEKEISPDSAKKKKQNFKKNKYEVQKLGKVVQDNTTKKSKDSEKEKVETDEKVLRKSKTFGKRKNQFKKAENNYEQYTPEKKARMDDVLKKEMEHSDNKMCKDNKKKSVKSESNTNASESKTDKSESKTDKSESKTEKSESLICNFSDDEVFLKKKSKKKKRHNVISPICSDSSPEKSPRRKRKGRYTQDDQTSDLESNRSPTNSSSDTQSPVKKKLHQLKRVGRRGRIATEKCVSMEIVDESSRDVLDLKSDGEDSSVHESPKGKGQPLTISTRNSKNSNKKLDSPVAKPEVSPVRSPKRRLNIEYSPTSEGKKKRVIGGHVKKNITKTRTRGLKKPKDTVKSRTMLDFVTFTKREKSSDEKDNSEKLNAHIRCLTFEKDHSESPSSANTSTVGKNKRGRPKLKKENTNILEPDKHSETSSIVSSRTCASDPTEPDKVRKILSDFATEAQYRAYLEEQDFLVALQLQADFDMEAKLNLTAIRRKGSDGEYEFRGRKCGQMQDFSLYFSDIDIRTAKHSKPVPLKNKKTRPKRRR